MGPDGNTSLRSPRARRDLQQHQQRVPGRLAWRRQHRAAGGQRARDLRPADQRGHRRGGRHQRLPLQRHGAQWEHKLLRRARRRRPTTAPTISTWSSGKGTTRTDERRGRDLRPAARSAPARQRRARTTSGSATWAAERRLRRSARRPWPTTARPTSTWWSGAATRQRRHANSKSTASESTPRRARPSAPTTSASATWGRTGIPTSPPRLPAVAYNSVEQRVPGGVARGRRHRAAGGQRGRDLRPAARRATGAEVGTNDFRISDMGPDGNTNFDAQDPAVAYNSTNNEYLVVWRGDDDTAPLVDNELEIFGQRLNAATGAAVGTNDFRISDMGPDGERQLRRLRPRCGLQQRQQRVPGGVERGRQHAPLVTARPRSSASGWLAPPARRSAPTTSASATWARTATSTLPPSNPRWPTTARATSIWSSGAGTTTPGSWWTASSRSSASG